MMATTEEPVPKKPQTSSSEDDERHIINVTDDSIYGYEHVIEKLMHREKPAIDLLVRRKQFINGIYRIRDGRTKRLTRDEIEIYFCEKIMWANLTQAKAKEILGTDKPAIFGNYLRDLRKYWSKHEMAFSNRPVMFQHFCKPIIKPVQEKLF